MAKIKINVNGVETEVDLETLDKETAESLGINIRDEVKNEIKKTFKFNKIKGKIIGITPFISLIACFIVRILGAMDILSPPFLYVTYVDVYL